MKIMIAMSRKGNKRTFRTFNVLLVLYVSTILPSLNSAITTTHYDKPQQETLQQSQINGSLSTSERQKRLLPYENFYLDHNFNRPILPNSNQYQPYQQPQPKKPVLLRYVTSKKYHQPPQHNGKFTPFLESNALPGGFRPLINNNPSPVKFQYVEEDSVEDEDARIPPNFSAIYDKLAQLKLRQQNTVRKPYNNYQPIRYQHHQEEPITYKIQPSKTTIETFTATNIDIPDPKDAHPENEEHVYQQYEPQKTYYPPQNENVVKPYVHQQLVLDLPPSSYAVPTYRKPAPQKNIIRKPVYYFPSRPNQDIVYQRQKTPPPRVFYLKKKPVPVAIVDDKYIAEKYVPQYQLTTPTYEEATQPLAEQRPQSISTENSNALSHILKELQRNNALPQTLSTENIDNSIKTLVRILEELKKRQKYPKVVDYDAENDDVEVDNDPHVTPNRPQQGFPDTENAVSSESFPDTPEGGTPGKPGIDYPALSSIPQTSFNCKTQRYKGFFGDPDTHCQVWHYCDLNGGQASFLCPNGTIFSQVALTCDWWYNVKCASTPQLYVLNERLYKYIIPLTPKFPEDYSGPLVDKYLAIKFQEMEEKLRKQKKGKGNQSTEEKDTDEEEESTTSQQNDEESDEDDETPEETKINEKSSISKPNTSEIKTKTEENDSEYQ